MTDSASKDSAAQPFSFFWLWGLPSVIIISTNFMSGVVPFPAIVAIISAAFFWIGLACLLNARRCRRRHCYYSGPVFVVAGIFVLLVGFEIVIRPTVRLSNGDRLQWVLVTVQLLRGLLGRTGMQKGLLGPSGANVLTT